MSAKWSFEGMRDWLDPQKINWRRVVAKNPKVWTRDRYLELYDLKVNEELTFKEIGAHFGCSGTTVRQRFIRLWDQVLYTRKKSEQG